MKRIRQLLVMILLMQYHYVLAQHTDLVDSSQKQVLSDTSKDGKYLLPELKNRQLKWTTWDNKLFSMRLGFAPIVDYTAFVQDNASETQVGKQKNQFDLRSGRIMFRGNIKFRQPWQYLISVEYKGMDRTEGQNAFGITDLAFTIPISKSIGKLTVGKVKETFVYEMVGDAANLPFTERILNPFFASRNVGIKLQNSLLDDKATYAVGWFNSWATSGHSLSNSANTYTARITGLPQYENNGRDFLHIALSARFTQAENDSMQYKGKDESNVSTNYIDTKKFEAKYAWNIGTEILWNKGPLSLLGEYVHNWTQSVQYNNPQFQGYYVTAAYILSGDIRPYDKKAAYARRVMPTHKYGAIELVVRYSHLDFDDQMVKGGVLDKGYFGFNWWATQFWRLTFGYGLSDLNRSNMHGTTNQFLWRIQWIY